MAAQEIATNQRYNDNKNHSMQILRHDAGGGRVIWSGLILELAGWSALSAAKIFDFGGQS